jgi:hypothetical protein
MSSRFNVLQAMNTGAGLILTIITLCCLSCNERRAESAVVDVSDTVTYQTHESGGGDLTISELSSVGIISLQKISLRAVIKNTGTAVAEIKPEMAELHCMNETRSTPVLVKSTMNNLSPNESAELMLEFEPMSSGLLFQQCGLRGDLEKSYRLTLPASIDGRSVNKKILLITDSLSLAAAVNSFGIADNIIPFRITEVIDNDSQKSEIQQVHSTDDHEGLRVSDNEILNHGFWMKVLSVHKHDTLYVKLRMVNQSLQRILISMPAFKVHVSDRAISPAGVFEKQDIELRNGGRAEITLKFLLKSVDAYSLTTDAIRFDGSKQRVVGSAVMFRSIRASH